MTCARAQILFMRQSRSVHAFQSTSLVPKSTDRSLAAFFLTLLHCVVYNMVLRSMPKRKIGAANGSGDGHSGSAAGSDSGSGSANGSGSGANTNTTNSGVATADLPSTKKLHIESITPAAAPTTAGGVTPPNSHGAGGSVSANGLHAMQTSGDHKHSAPQQQNSRSPLHASGSGAGSGLTANAATSLKTATGGGGGGGRTSPHPKSVGASGMRSRSLRVRFRVRLLSVC